jgi:hypothetical protein
MKTKITKTQFFTLSHASQYIANISTWNEDSKSYPTINHDELQDIACELSTLLYELYPEDDDSKTVAPDYEKLILDGLQKLHDRCVQMKESYENNIDMPECQLDWLKNYKKWEQYFDIARSEGYDHGHKVAPKPPFSWESVVIGGDTEA